ncbi:hypothetical protein [Saccharopolyspora tripterygii]
MEWLMLTAAAAVVLALARRLRRYAVRRRSVARAKTELNWFHPPAKRRPYVQGCGKHASPEPVVVLRRIDGSPLGRVPRPAMTRRR